VCNRFEAVGATFDPQTLRERRERRARERERSSHSTLMMIP
jgi:hypothetical protein